MRITISKTLPKQNKAIAFFVFSDRPLAHYLRGLSSAVRTTVVRAAKGFDPNEGKRIIHLPEKSIETILLFGLGKSSALTQTKFERAIRSIVRSSAQLKQYRLNVVLPEWESNERRAFLAAYNAMLASYVFKRYKSKPKLGMRAVALIASAMTKEMNQAVQRAIIIGEEVNNARDLSNTPGADMTPAQLAEHARQDGKRAGYTVTVLDEKKMESLGMGGILGVSKGSAEGAKMVICEYAHPEHRKDKPVVYVGKGVTFDTGGLNIKPDMSMLEMHMDMTGGSSVIHAIAAIARLRIPIRVIGIVPAVENMPGSAGYRPGDVLRTYGGKTIEVKNTDAEGRIILADALSFAKTYHPKVIIDIATLTGAALVALGQRMAAVLSPDNSLAQDLIRCGKASGEQLWEFPLTEEWKKDLDSEVADIANIAKHRYGGTIIGAAFLWPFAPLQRWAHIDIAPVMLAIDEDHLAHGSKGFGTHLLITYAEQYAKENKGRAS
jgi:leucyl aminopeptidase